MIREQVGFKCIVGDMLAYCSLSDYVTVGYNETPSGVKPVWFDTLFLYSRIIANPGTLYSRIIVNPGTLVHACCYILSHVLLQ